MNLRDLNYLVALAEYSHFGKAAARCFISQPTLSMQIKKLEHELGVSLLERGSKSVLLTDVGLKVVAYAKEILQQAAQIRQITAVARDPEAGELKVGIIPTLAPYFLPCIIAGITQQFPRIKLYLFEEQTAHLLSKLSQGTLDTAILTLPVITPEFTASHLFDEPFRLAVAAGHRLSRKKLIKPADLVDEKLLLLAEGHCLRDQALAVCNAANALENGSFQGTSLETLRHMIAAGMGVTLMPELACKLSEEVAYVDFAVPKPMRTIGMLWRTSSVRVPLLTAVSALIKKIMTQEL